MQISYYYLLGSFTVDPTKGVQRWEMQIPRTCQHVSFHTGQEADCKGDASL